MKRADDPQNLVIAWQGYSWEDKSLQPWDGKICPTCLEAIPVVRGKLALHMRDRSQPGELEADFLCPSGGQKADIEFKKALCGSWIVVDRDTAKTLGSHATEEKARYQANEILKSSGLAPVRADSTVRRFDRVTINPAKRTQEGFLKLDGSKIARTGIQVYRRADGSTMRELREPEQVFDAASMKAFSLLPLTFNHPMTLLDATNAKAHAVGSVGEASKLDDTWLTAPISVWDEATIKAIEMGQQELSVGYTCKLDETPGEHPVYGKYDARQENVVANHLAIVPFARAGHEARLRLDGSDAEAMTDAISGFETPMLALKTETETNRMAHKFKLDGIEVTVEGPNDETHVRRAIEAAQKKGEELTATEKQRADASDKGKGEAEKAKGEAQKALDTLQGKYDALDSKAKADAARTFKLDGADVSLVEFVDDVKREALLETVVSKRAQARTALVIEAQRHLGTKEKLDGKSDLEVKKMVVAKLDKNAKLDGKSDDYVQARFDAAIEGAKPVSAIDAARAAAAGPTVIAAVADAAPGTAEEARKAMVQRAVSANVKTGAR